MIRDFLNQIKKTVVFIGKPTDDRKGTRVVGTGALVELAGVTYLATAKHVIFRSDEKGNILEKRNDLFGIVNTSDSKYTMAAIPLADLGNSGSHWIYDANDPLADLTLLEFNYHVIDKDGIFSDVEVIKESSFVDPSLIYETLDVFYISNQPGLTDPSSDNRVSPVIRSGMISRINQDNKTFYIDGFAFPGNSGSPVFDKASGNFLGIITGYLPFTDVAISQQTGNPRVFFEDNTGLSIVWSAKNLREIVTRPRAEARQNLLPLSEVVPMPVEAMPVPQVDNQNN